MRKIEIVLHGQPMPKQSVKQGKTFKGKKIFYQPKKLVDRKKDYIQQIKQQIPANFKLFTKWVHVTELTFVFEPLVKHKKIKYKMEHLSNGGYYENTTKPDLTDNLNKLPFDCMSGLVFDEDSRISKMNNVSKVYGLEPKIIIKLEGE